MRLIYKDNAATFIYLLYLFYIMETQITVKEVDEQSFRKLKAFAVQRKMKVGSALSLAIEFWLSSVKTKKDTLSELKPISWGKGTEHLSEDLDSVLYG